MKSGQGLTSDSAATAFPADGARHTAAAIVDLLARHQAAPATGALTWHKISRPEVARAKFSASRDEFVAALVSAGRDLALPHVDIQELDDSLVLMTPAAGPVAA
jgi:hypothetical protein